MRHPRACGVLVLIASMAIGCGTQEAPAPTTHAGGYTVQAQTSAYVRSRCRRLCYWVACGPSRYCRQACEAVFADAQGGWNDGTPTGPPTEPSTGPSGEPSPPTGPSTAPSGEPTAPPTGP